MTSLEAYLEEKTCLVDQYLNKVLPPDSDYPSSLHQAMRYSVFSGGKRFRPILTLVAAEASGGKLEDAIGTASALELIHTYSLIHDDLPSLDNADERRGKASCHKQFGEEIAILAGDALLTYAFEIMDLRVVKDIAKAIGTKGMVGGQVADMEKGNKKMKVDDYEYLHAKKTGALIAVSAKAGAVIAGADQDALEKIFSYGKLLGVAFQIIDDIFDKEDYAVMLGSVKAREKSDNMIQQAKDEVKDFDEKAWMLDQLADYVVQRKL